MSSGSHTAAPLKHKQSHQGSHTTTDNALKLTISLPTKQSMKDAKTSTSKSDRSSKSSTDVARTGISGITANPSDGKTPPSVTKPPLNGDHHHHRHRDHRDHHHLHTSTTAKILNASPTLPPSLPSSHSAQNATGGKSRTASPTKRLHNGSSGVGGVGGVGGLTPLPSPGTAMGKAHCLFFGPPPPLSQLPPPPLPPLPPSHSLFPPSAFPNFNNTTAAVGHVKRVVTNTANATNGDSDVMSKITEILGTTRKIRPANPIHVVTNIASTPAAKKDPAPSSRGRKEPVPIRPAVPLVSPPSHDSNSRRSDNFSNAKNANDAKNRKQSRSLSTAATPQQQQRDQQPKASVVSDAALTTHSGVYIQPHQPVFSTLTVAAPPPSLASGPTTIPSTGIFSSDQPILPSRRRVSPAASPPTASRSGSSDAKNTKNPKNKPSHSSSASSVLPSVPGPSPLTAASKSGKKRKVTETEEARISRNPVELPTSVASLVSPSATPSFAMTSSAPLPQSFGSFGSFASSLSSTPSFASFASSAAVAQTVSSNEDLDQLLSSLQTKITQQFGGSDRKDANFLGATGVGRVPERSSLPTAPLPASEVRARLKAMRRSVKVVDVALDEQVRHLTDWLERIVFLSPRKTTDTAARTATSGSKTKSGHLQTATGAEAASTDGFTVESVEEPICVLPFKKRLYKSVPSPKTKDANDAAKLSGKDGRENNASSGGATPSRSAAVASATKSQRDVQPTPPTTVASAATANTSTAAVTASHPKQPSLKLSLKFNQSTGKAYCNSPNQQSSISRTSSSPKNTSSPRNTSSPKTASTSPVVKKGSKKRKSSDVNVQEGVVSKRKSSTSVVVGEYGMTCNRYSEARLRKQPHRDRDLMQCECRPPSPSQPVTAVGCGEDCGSRMSFIECDASLCPCGSRCSNQQIQRGLGVMDLELFPTQLKGQGVRSRSTIKKGTFVCEYVGEVLSMDKFRERMKQPNYSEASHHYCLKLDSSKVIDAYRCGGIARFINHSCEPNCQTQKWLVNGHDRMAIFAREDISAGEELTYDYKFESFDMQQKCFCGAKTCRGFTGVQKSQKLNGLLMKKRQPTAPSADVAPLPVSTQSFGSPKLSVPAPSRETEEDLNRSDVSEPLADPVREKYLMSKGKICLARNIRGATLHERKIQNRRPKVSPLSRTIAVSLPSLAGQAVRELFPAPKCFPAEYFKPVPWEPSVADVARYSSKPFREEVVRCICGITLDEGTMIECDQCKSWQHCECVGVIPEQKKAYSCERCSPRIMPREIHQNLPASSNPDSLDCYVSLLVPNCQDFYVRVGDCVYLTKDRKSPEPGVFYDPITVDILYIDKMWIDAEGVKQIWGWHYLRPNETFHEAGRSFFEMELFRSQHIERAPMQAVLGRCCIMDSVTYAKGRPKEYPLHHCFVCDNKVNKSNNQFVTLKSKDKIPLNQSRYCFEYYAEKLPLRRTFKPHQIPVLKKKLKAEAARKKATSPNSDLTSVVKERCERIHAVLESLAVRKVT